MWRNFQTPLILLSLLWIHSGLLISLKIQHSKQGALFLNFWIWDSGPRFPTWFGSVSRIDNLWQCKRPEGRVPDPFEECLTDWGGREGFLRDDGRVEFWRVWQAEGKSKCDALRERGRRSGKGTGRGARALPFLFLRNRLRMVDTITWHWVEEAVSEVEKWGPNHRGP